jgi:hypothetical protein
MEQEGVQKPMLMMMKRRVLDSCAWEEQQKQTPMDGATEKNWSESNHTDGHFRQEAERAVEGEAWPGSEQQQQQHQHHHNPL